MPESGNSVRIICAMDITFASAIGLTAFDEYPPGVEYLPEESISGSQHCFPDTLEFPFPSPRTRTRTRTKGTARNHVRADAIHQLLKTSHMTAFPLSLEIFSVSTVFPSFLFALRSETLSRNNEMSALPFHTGLWTQSLKVDAHHTGYCVDCRHPFTARKQGRPSRLFGTQRY